MTDTENIILVDISKEKAVLAYPNPVTDILYLRPLIHDLKDIHLVVSTLNGQVILNQSIDLRATQNVFLPNMVDQQLILSIYDKEGRMIQTEKLIYLK